LKGFRIAAIRYQQSADFFRIRKPRNGAFLSSISTDPEDRTDLRSGTSFELSVGEKSERRSLMGFSSSR